MRKPSFFWPLRLIVLCALVGPAGFLVYSYFENMRAIEGQTEERIARALDVLQEHASKALQTVDRSISEIGEVLRGLPDGAIREQEAEISLRLKRTQQTLPQMESIWAFDRDGRPLVSSTILPVPIDLDNSDRSYFRSQRDTDPGLFVSEVISAKIGSLSFFVVSARRGSEPVGRFNGVVAVTVRPEHFTEFYRKLSRGADSFALRRDDGTLLARYPELSGGSSPGVGLLPDEIRRQRDDGRFKTVSPVDGVERLVGYRKVPGYPLYVQAAVETRSLERELHAVILRQAAYGLPFVLATLGLALYALRGAQRFQKEVSRREAAEAALKQSQRLDAMGELTGGVAHDFNNLLMIIGGNVDRIRRLSLDEPRLQRSIDAIFLAYERGLSLTRQLLSFSRRQTHEPQRLALGDRLPAFRDVVSAGLPGDIVLAIEVDASVGVVNVDPSEFELALLNLVMNARDATPNGGRITISARNAVADELLAADADGEFVAVTVSDSGLGIPDDIQDRVLEPFFTTKEVGKGTGLGLSQVYGFVQQAGGKLALESAIGSGTSVTMFLPRVAAAAEALAVDAGFPPDKIGTGRTALVVEDNGDVAEVTRQLLLELGFEVFSVSKPDAALRIMELGDPKVDIVISDIVMPGQMNGVDLGREIRRRFGDDFPLLLVTGYSERAAEAIESGFRLLRKPYSLAELHAALLLVKRQ